MIVLAMLAVTIGGGLGSAARWGIGHLWRRVVGIRATAGVPWPTFCANVLACFLLGVVVTWLGSASGGVARTVYALAATGFCGGLSTLSSFALEVVSLTRRGAAVISLGYLMLSAGAGMVALWLGLVLAA